MNVGFGLSDLSRRILREVPAFPTPTVPTNHAYLHIVTVTHNEALTRTVTWFDPTKESSGLEAAAVRSSAESGGDTFLRNIGS
jgi:hypothetical protein